MLISVSSETQGSRVLLGLICRKGLRLEAEDQLASANREGVGMVYLLKGQDRSLQAGSSWG